MSDNKTIRSSILSVVHGSHAYGLNTPESDEDIRGILVESIEEFVSYNRSFEQVQNHAHDGHEQDLTLFGLRKFAKLSADANPNALEILFVEPSEIIKKDKFGQKLIDNRDIFLTKKMFYTFGGYARSQLARLNGHRRWILNPPNPPISREEFGLPSKPKIDSNTTKAIQATISKKLDQWNLKDLTDQDAADRIEIIATMSEFLAEMEITLDDKWLAAGRSLGFDDNILEILNKERQYDNIISEYKQYKTWEVSRNKKRYETEVRCGCDTKHASHLIRLYLQCIDALKGNGLILKRNPSERQLLLDIKQGRHGKDTYEVVSKLQVELEAENMEALKQSTLPNQIDSSKLDEIVRDIYLESWFGMDRKNIAIAEVLLRNR